MSAEYANVPLNSLVSYQLRSSYLDDIADGVGERLITLNDGFLNSAAYKAAGWRTNHALSKRTHSPPIPTAIASEYFQAPRSARHTLEDEAEDGGMLTAGGDSTLGPGMAIKRRRRREQMEEDDSSDLSDDSDDESDTRPAQQIKFAKMPVRGRAGSSPLQSSNLRQMTTASPPRVGAGARRGSQSALDTVKERVRRDTVTSSEVSSENEFDASGFHRHREQARQAARMAAAKASRSRAKSNDDITPGVPRHDSLPLQEEEEESDASDISDAAFAESLDSASILDAVDNPIVDNPIHPSPTVQVVGTPPRVFARQSTIRRSHAPQPRILAALPPPRPLSTIRPVSMIQPVSMLTELLKTKKSKSKPTMPFQNFASLSGEGDNRKPMLLRIYPAFSEDPDEHFEVLIRRDVSDDAGNNFRVVTVGDAIGLSLLRYIQEKRQPTLPADKLNVNWYSLRIVEEGGEIDDDFPPLERKKPLASFTTANNRAAASNFQQGAASRGGGRGRANSNKAHDEFALVQASPSEYEDNKRITPEFEPEEEVAEDEGEAAVKDTTPRSTPQPELSLSVPYQPRQNPVLTTTHRAGILLDQPQVATSVQHARGQQKLLRVNILSSDTAPGQLVTLDVTTDTYLAEVLDLVCKKRQLDKVNHVLKIPNSGAVVMVDRPVASLGAVSELELHRRRFATDGPLTVTGSPSSSSPKLPFGEGQQKRWKKDKFMGAHPLAREALKQDELNNANYKKYTVWRKQPMRIVGMSERVFIIDGEYVHIMAASGAKGVDGGRKATTVHFSNVVGCKVMRKHPTTFKVRHIALLFGHGESGELLAKNCAGRSCLPPRETAR